MPLTLAAAAYLAELEPHNQPRSLTLIGGPVDPDAAPTEVTDFGRRVTMGQLEHLAIQRVGAKYAGVGRLVYPGLAQLASFISMNLDRHSAAFRDKIIAEAKGEGRERDKHNRFYDEYLSVMDMTAEFYMSTVFRIFKNRKASGAELSRPAICHQLVFIDPRKSVANGARIGFGFEADNGKISHAALLLARLLRGKP